MKNHLMLLSALILALVLSAPAGANPIIPRVWFNPVQPWQIVAQGPTPYVFTPGFQTYASPATVTESVTPNVGNISATPGFQVYSAEPMGQAEAPATSDIISGSSPGFQIYQGPSFVTPETALPAATELTPTTGPGFISTVGNQVSTGTAGGTFISGRGTTFVQQPVVGVPVGVVPVQQGANVIMRQAAPVPQQIILQHGTWDEPSTNW